MSKAMLLVNHNSQRQLTTYMPFGPRSWMNDSWLTPTNSIWERKRDSSIFITLKSTILFFFCFIKVTCHKGLQSTLSRCYPPSLKHLQEDQGKYFGWVFCWFILDVLWRTYFRTIKCITLSWIFGWNGLKFDTVLGSVWSCLIPQILSSLQGPSQKDWKGNEDT